MLKTFLYNAPVDVKLLTYKTLCKPLLEYASDVWHPFWKRDICAIEMVQLQAVRFILGLRGICSVSEGMAKLGLSTIAERRVDKRKITLLDYIKYLEKHKAMINYFERFTNYAEDVQTRQITKFLPRVSRTNTNVFYNSFLPRTMRQLRRGGDALD